VHGGSTLAHLEREIEIGLEAGAPVPISKPVAHFIAREAKQASDGARVVLLQNRQDGSWFVGSDDDPHLHPIPLGAFASREAARQWADDRFLDGEWRRVAGRSR
jgi:hypothetical protein